MTVDEFERPGDLRVAAVQRGKTVAMVPDDFALRDGDLVVAATRPSVHAKVRQYLRADGQ